MKKNLVAVLTALVLVFAAALCGQQVQKFGEFEIILPQDGEVMVASVPQIKAAIVEVLSPLPNESFESHQRRVNGFLGDFQTAPKNYSGQLAVVQAHYVRVSAGKKVEELQAPACRPEENIMIKFKDEVTLGSGQKWTPFTVFREDPVGEEINGLGSDAEIFVRVRPQIDSAIDQVLRTSYDPFMKTEWIEKLRAFKAGSTGSDAGSPKVHLLREWSKYWEITRGKNSVLENAEFLPTEEWRDAKVVVFKLEKSCREVGHALPCGLNPIVPKYRTSIRTDFDYDRPNVPTKPSQVECKVVTSRDGRPSGSEIFPDETLRLDANFDADMSQLELKGLAWEVNGQTKLQDQISFEFRPADYRYRTGTYNIRFSMKDQFGRITACSFVVVVKERPVEVPLTQTTTLDVPSGNTGTCPACPRIEKGRGKCGGVCKALIIAGGALGACAAVGCFGGHKNPPAAIVPTKPATPAIGVASVGGIRISFGSGRTSIR